MLQSFLNNIPPFRYLKSDGPDMTKQSIKENKEKFWELKECLQFIGFSQNVSSVASRN